MSGETAARVKQGGLRRVTLKRLKHRPHGEEEAAAKGAYPTSKSLSPVSICVFPGIILLFLLFSLFKKKSPQTPNNADYALSRHSSGRVHLGRLMLLMTFIFIKGSPPRL